MPGSAGQGVSNLQVTKVSQCLGSRILCRRENLGSLLRANQAVYFGFGNVESVVHSDYFVSVQRNLEGSRLWDGSKGGGGG